MQDGPPGCSTCRSCSAPTLLAALRRSESPMALKAASISRLICVDGCRRPRIGRRPGRVTSMQLEDVGAAVAARRSANSASRWDFAWFAAAPTDLRSLSGRAPRLRSAAVSAPLRPRYLTRHASTPLSVSPAADRSFSASVRRRSMVCSVRALRSFTEFVIERTSVRRGAVSTVWTACNYSRWPLDPRRRPSAVLSLS